jgi:hypothetical protein
MLFDLLERDIAGFHPRQIVRTKALARQQEEHLDPKDQFWLALLQSGFIGTGGVFPHEAATSDYEVVEDDPARANWKRTVKRPGLLSLARESSPKLKAISEAAFGRFLIDRGCSRIRFRIGKPSEHDALNRRQVRGWRFPTLAEARADWEARFPETDWGVAPTAWKREDQG